VRDRDDDRIVELFLDAFQKGRFAKNPDWLHQYEANVEVISTADDGTRLAIEHTRIFSFDGQSEQEKALKPIAECLESVRLPGVPDRWYQVYFGTNFMGRTLQKHRAAVLDSLRRWALSELPALEPRDYFRYPLTIPVPLPNGKTANIEVGVEVWDNMQVDRQVCVSGILPSGDRLTDAVRRALEKKLPKTAAADAHLRFLLIDQPTPSDSEIGVLRVIRELAPEFPLLQEIQALGFAKTYLLHESVIYFSLWNVRTGSWSEYLRAEIAKAN